MSGRVTVKIVIIATVCSWLNPAQAATIFNLSNKPQVVEVRRAEGFVPVTIEPNHFLREPGKIKVRYKGREVNLEQPDEYAIWKDDSFGPQKYHSRGAGRLD